MTGFRPAPSLALVRTPLIVAFAGLWLLSLLSPAMEMTPLFPAGPVRLLRGAAYPALVLLAVLAVQPWREPRTLRVIPWPLLLLLAWSAFSLLWSAVPGIGTRQLVLTACATALPCLCVRHLGYQRSLSVVQAALFVALLVNFAAVLLYPQIGTHDFGNSWAQNQWRGLMGHKNIAGLLAALTVIVFLLDPPRGLPRPAGYAVAAAAAAFLVLTDSRTALVATPVALAAGVLVRFGRAGIVAALTGPRRRLVIGVGLALCAAVVALLLFATFDQDALLAIASDPNALSNRGTIWEPLLRYYGEHPLSGSGFGSFWDTAAQDNARNFNGTWLGDIAQGHDGYLDLLVQIGMPGLVLALGALIVWPVTTLCRVLPTASPAACGLIAAVLVFCLGDNITESSIFSRDTLGHVFLILAVAMLASLRDEQSLARNPSRRRRRRRATGEEPVRRPA